MFQRESGILLHPSSLPSPYGIGDLGHDCLQWIRVLDQTRQRLWQILPLNPVGTGFSPYHTTSSFAGDTLLLSPALLGERGLLTSEELSAAELPGGRIAARELLATKPALITLAGRRFLERASPEERDGFDSFRAEQAHWLLDFARHEAIKGDRSPSWLEWPSDLRRREPATLNALDRDLARPILEAQVLQYLFERQWQSVRRLANLKRIRVIGDLPIFVALESADVWANQHLFQLDVDGSPSKVAGVPPDYFAKDGQRWGNPLYDWEAHRAEGFAWWTRRVARTLDLTDIVRVDHFRGFAACWEIPAHEPTAKNGRWVPTPGRELFERVIQNLGRELPIIAEDLGLITDDVVALREHFGFPGMRVLQFSFSGEDEFLPHNYPENCVAYTGTHDNDSTVGWYSSPPETNSLTTPEAVAAERDLFRRYYRTDGTHPHWTAIQRLMAGHTCAVVFPWQDVLGLGSESRMNTPGTVGPHNWTWRFEWSQLEPSMLDTLLQITRETGRNAH